LSLWLAGMDFFDAACHSIAALATGGFSTHRSGFLYYQAAEGTIINGAFPVNSVAIEIIAMVLMLLGATNFVLHTFLLTGHWKKFFKDIEIRLALIVIPVFALATASASLYLYDGDAAWVTTGASLNPATYVGSLRYNAFNVISSLSTTGFQNAPSISALGEVTVFCAILLMGIGGGVGSTSGGIKQYRVALLLKDFVYSIRQRTSSNHAINPNPVYRLGEKSEEDPSTADEAHNYAILYIVVFLLGSLVLAFLPSITFQQSLYDYMSALSGTGLDIIDFVNYKKIQPLAYPWLLLILDVAMFIGRLEILPIHFAFQRLSVNSVYNIKHRHHKAKEA
jgi:trk system potassium uptake protein TrkH